MTSISLKKKYAPQKKIESFFTQKFVQITEDGAYLFCQCSDRLNVIQLSSGKVIQKIESEEDEITSVSLSPNNCFLALGFNSSSIKHYEIKDLETFSPVLLTSFRSYHRGPVLTLCWDASSVLLATGSSDGSVRVWDLKQKFCTHSLKEALGVVRVLMFDSNLKDRPWLYGAAEETIVIWRLESGASVVQAKLSGHDSAVTALQLSHSRELLISCGLDKVIIVWDLNTLISKKIIPVFESLSGLILKPLEANWCGITEDPAKANVVFAIGNNATPRIWDVDKGKELWKSSDRLIPEPEGDKDVLIFPQVYSCPNLDSIVLTTHDHNIMFLRTKSMTAGKQLVGHNDEILDIILLGEELSYTVVASNSSQIRLYDNSDSSCNLISGHSATVLALANHPSEPMIFGSSSHDNSARLWRVQKSGFAFCIAIATGHTHSVGCIALAKDFLITGSRDTCIKKWKVDLSNVSTRGGLNKLSSERTQKAHEKDINSIALSKNFKFLATASLDRSAKLWDSSSLDLLGTFSGHRKGIWGVEFSPVDRLLATASADATIKIWNLADFSNVATFEGHEVGVLNVSWVSNGLQLLSCASDGLLKLWTLKENICVASFDEHEGKVWALAVAQEGRCLVTGGVDSTLIWWQDVTEEEKKKEEEEKQRTVEEEQTLLNFLQEKKWSKALGLALRLRQPHRGLSIMKELLDNSPSELDSVLQRLKKGQLTTLIEFALQWNTKTKNMREAQGVLNYLLREHSADELEALPDWQKTLEHFLPYTERHMKRVSALHQSASIIHYMNSCLSLAGQGTSIIEESIDVKDEEIALLEMIPRVKIKENFILNDSGMEVSSDEEKIAEATDSEQSEEETEEEEDDEDINEKLPEDLQPNFIVEDIVASSSSNDESEVDDT